MEEIVTLASIGNGAALELFECELTRVIENIADPNTPTKKKREITLKITVEPDEDRSVGYVKIECSSKLAAMKPVQQAIYFGRKDGKLVAVANNVNEPSLFDEPGKPPLIRPVGFIAPGGTA